jgi:hypothetical protein
VATLWDGRNIELVRKPNCGIRDGAVKDTHHQINWTARADTAGDSKALDAIVRLPNCYGRRPVTVVVVVASPTVDLAVAAELKLQPQCDITNRQIPVDPLEVGDALCAVLHSLHSQRVPGSRCVAKLSRHRGPRHDHDKIAPRIRFEARGLAAGEP